MANVFVPFDPMSVPTRTLAAAAIGGVAAAEAGGYRWDELNETWRRSDSRATVIQQVIPPGTTFVDYNPTTGEAIYDARALNPLEVSEAPAAAARNLELERHYRESAEKAAYELAHPVDIQELNRAMAIQYGQAGAASAGAGPIRYTGKPIVHCAAGWTGPDCKTPWDPYGPTVIEAPMNGNGVYIQPSSPLNIGSIIGGAALGFLTGGPAGAVLGGVGGALGQPGYIPGATAGYNPGYGGSCPAGYVTGPDGRCMVAGVTGTVQRWLPGGQTGYLPTTQTTGPQQVVGPSQPSQAVAGMFGAGYVPVQVGTAYGRPLLRCYSGMVLGKDNVCYREGSLRRGERKWPRARRPLLSANDGKILEKAHGLEHKLLRVAGRFLATPRPRAKRKGAGRAKSKR